MNGLESWGKEFRIRNQCPWPGPRTLEDTADDRLKLIGRDAESRDVLDMIIDYPIVILSASSGIGKSSFVNAGLLSELDKNNRFALVCNKYVSGAQDPERIIFNELERTGQLEPLGISSLGPGLFAQLDDVLSDRAVVVLDQFEELIRHQSWLVRRMLDLIPKVVREHQTRFVLSLRSEYEHRLAPLLESASPFAVTTHRLREISGDNEIREVIESGNKTTPGSIDRNATKAVLAEWQTHRDHCHERGVETSLLHLQAALYALYAFAGSRSIESSHVVRFGEEAGKSSLAFFEHGIQEAIARKMDMCEEAFTTLDGLGTDRALLLGTRALARRMTERLSSGGYKLTQNEESLALTSADPELKQLRADDTAPLILRALRACSEQAVTDGQPGRDEGRSEVEAQKETGAHDLLTVPATSVLEQAGLSTSVPPMDRRVAALGIDAEPWTVDVEDVSAGPMLGLPPLAIAVEELRRAVFALEWLETAQLIRRTQLPDDRTEVSLIHDGYGDALNQWRRRQRVGHEEAELRLTAARGARFEWGTVGPAELTTDEQAYHLVVNARWRDCEIIAVAFRGVVFVNCDFRGTRFRGCTFTETVFINCLLDHVTFSGCEVEGLPEGGAFGGLTVRSDADSGPRVDRPRMPSYQLTGDSAAAAAGRHRRYRLGVFPGTSVRSVASGLPALPFDAPPSSRSVFTTPTRLGSGGLTIHGGRLNALTLRGCVFDVSTGGVLTMNDIAGSSLELVEQEQAVIRIKRGLIRGLTITRPVDAPRKAPEPAPRDADVELLVENSVLANTWIGDGLRGSVRISSSQIWQFWTLSDSAALEVRIEDCLYTGLVNVEGPSDPDSKPVRAAAPPFNAESFLDRSWAMDFRSTPARAEILSE